MTDQVCDSIRKVNYPKQTFDTIVKRKTQDILSMQIIGELLVQMRINIGIVRRTKNLNARQFMLSLGKKKQTTELKSRGADYSVVQITYSQQLQFRASSCSALARLTTTIVTAISGLPLN